MGAITLWNVPVLLARPGYVIAPTVVADIAEGTRLVDEEPFGPVLPVILFSDVDDAVRRTLLPSRFHPLRLVRAWRTLIAAELVFGANTGAGGLGWYIYQNRNELYTDRVFAGLLTVILIGPIWPCRRRQPNRSWTSRGTGMTLRSGESGWRITFRCITFGFRCIR